jgi:uncharacterized protein YqjF (DUF2071 family)
MRTVMFQEWRNLLFLHWEVDRNSLQQLVPRGLEIDTFEDKAYFGLVLFTMKGIRPRNFFPIPGASAFHEFNARTYVKHGDKSGVWFFSLDAASALAVTVARAQYKLAYFHAEMDHQVTGPRFTYQSRRRNSDAMIVADAEISGDVWHALPGTLDHFLIERYRLFAGIEGALKTALVDHEPYPLRQASLTKLQESLSSSAGVVVEGDPIVHFADGVSARIGAIEQV